MRDILNHCPRVHWRSRRELKWTGVAGFLLRTNSSGPAGPVEEPTVIRHLCVSSRPFTPSCGPVRPSETFWIGPPAAHDLPCISRLAAPCPAPMSCLESCGFERFRPSQRRAMDISRRHPADLEVVNASFRPAGAAAFRPSGSLSFSTALYTSGRTKTTGYRLQVRQRCRIRSARPGHPVYPRRILFILSLHTRCPAADGPSCRFGFYSPRCARNSRRPRGSRNCRADSLVFLVPGDEKKISEKRTSVDQHHERTR